MLRYCHGVDGEKDRWLLVGSGVAVTFITAEVLVGLFFLLTSWVRGETGTGMLILCLVVLFFLSPLYVELIKYVLWNIECYQLLEDGILVQTRFYKRLIRWEDVQDVCEISVWVANYRPRPYIAVFCSQQKMTLSEDRVPNLTDCFRNRNIILTIRYSDVRLDELKRRWNMNT